MTKDALAAASIEIERPLRASLARDVMGKTPDPDERAKLGAAVLALLLRKYLEPLPGPKAEWLEHIVRAALL